MKRQHLILGCSLLISTSSFAIEKPQAITVSTEIKQLLNQEMQLLETGMQQLLSAIISADWNKTMTLGQQIQASFIIKKTLTAQQKTELHQHLPKTFIELDQSFHQYAGLLAEAAAVKNQETVNFYFYKMLDRCTQCHSRYALEKFPAFSVNQHKH